MSEIPNRATPEAEPEWNEVLCWFGSACWPESATYRDAGERVRKFDEENKEWVELTSLEELEAYQQDIMYAPPAYKK